MPLFRCQTLPNSTPFCPGRPRLRYCCSTSRPPRWTLRRKLRSSKRSIGSRRGGLPSSSRTVSRQSSMRTPFAVRGAEMQCEGESARGRVSAICRAGSFHTHTHTASRAHFAISAHRIAAHLHPYTTPTHPDTHHPPTLYPPLALCSALWRQGGGEGHARGVAAPRWRVCQDGQVAVPRGEAQRQQSAKVRGGGHRNARLRA